MCIWKRIKQQYSVYFERNPTSVQVKRWVISDPDHVINVAGSRRDAYSPLSHRRPLAYHLASHFFGIFYTIIKWLLLSTKSIESIIPLKCRRWYILFHSIYTQLNPDWKWPHTDIYTVGLENGEYGDIDDPNSGVEAVTWKNGVRTVLPFLPSTANVSGYSCCYCSQGLFTKCYYISPLVLLTSGRWHAARMHYWKIRMTAYLPSLILIIKL